jgi:hypothetical protein
MNTSNSINISYTWDKETFLKASKTIYDYELNNSNRKYIVGIAMTIDKEDMNS